MFLFLSRVLFSAPASSSICGVIFFYPRVAYLHNLLDLIIVLKEGKVVEQGTHEELMQEKGLYYSMWLQQASSEGAGNGGLE